MSRFDLEKLYRCPEYRIVDEENNIKGIFYENESYLDKATEAFAYIGIPAGVKKPVPAMVCVHGGGGTAFKEWVETWNTRGYAAIAMDWNGKGPDGESHAASGPNNKFEVEAKWSDTWTYHAICAVIRAHSLLRHFPEVDAERIGISGVSWGGYLTCCVSGIDKRFKMAVSAYGCGFLQDNSAAEWMSIFNKMKPEQKKWWNDNCDPSAYLKYTTMPMLFVTGTNDCAYPLDSLRKTCLELQGRAQTCIRLEMGHAHSHAWKAKETGFYADSILKDSLALPFVGELTRKVNKVNMEYSSQLPVKGYLLYTCDSGIWMDRKWFQVEASVDKQQVTAELTSEATACFLAVEDTRGAYINSLPEVYE